MPAGSTAEDGLLPSHEIDFQWHELSKMVDPEGAAMHNLDHNQTSATDGPPTSDVTVSFANHTPDSRTSMEAMTSIPEATQFNQTPQQSDNLFWNSLPRFSSSTLSGTQTPQMEANRTIMNELIDFNTRVSHDL